VPTYSRPAEVAHYYGVVTIDAADADEWIALVSDDFTGPDGLALPEGLVLVGYAVQNEGGAGQNIYTAGPDFDGAVAVTTRTPGGSSSAINLRGVGGSLGETGLAYRKSAAGIAGQIRTWWEVPA
jgi:hypothetical protein